MNTDFFFQKINSYHTLSAEGQLAWAKLLTEKVYKKGDNFISIGQSPRKIAFVVKGLFSQNYIGDEGDVIIKYFFPENRLAGSMSAMLAQVPSQFHITAIETTSVLEYDFSEFKKLLPGYNDIAMFYIKYMEQHWIVEKEPLEISLRADTAKSRYEDFLHKYPNLVKRLKKHHIASYLGITPTQLSRIFFANK